MSYLATYKQSTLDPPPPPVGSPCSCPSTLEIPHLPPVPDLQLFAPSTEVASPKKKHHLQSFLTPIQSPQTAFRRPKTEPDCCAMG